MEKPITDLMLVNRAVYLNSLEALHLYKGELLGNLELAFNSGDQEWASGLQEQIDIIDGIHHSFTSAIHGFHKSGVLTN